MTNEEFKKKRDRRTEDLISQIQRHDNTIANIVKSAYERGYADGNLEGGNNREEGKQTITRLIEERFLDKICCYRALRAKKDSHAECEYYCSFPPRDYGNEPICKYQCTKEAKNE